MDVPLNAIFFIEDKTPHVYKYTLENVYQNIALSIFYFTNRINPGGIGSFLCGIYLALDISLLTMAFA